ncbi:DUF3685 domain-containing protein [Argonema galeatum]|uniref:DUF3685 domain-containing protein n=1 Tax=Argonema galeatum TaxID=2942762 RepID=UPI00201325C5|nr:DUF3685 domain-containing protein [Argonema galeatum]MCL1467575.1 DUF3685 domain-containing protein [Argonema galeatum A003/A1]
MSDLVKPDLGGRPESPLNLLLIDDDPIFGAGLRVVASQFIDLQSIALARSSQDALQILQSGEPPVTLVILDLGLGRLPNDLFHTSEFHQDRISGLELCQQLKTQYPHLPILLLSSFLEPVLLAAARQLGVEGYCPKGCAVSELVDAIRQVAAGQSYWPSELIEAPLAGTPSPQSRTQAGVLPTLLNNIRLSGVRQIEAALAEVTDSLQNARLSALDRAILAGRRRELKAARGLLNKLLGQPTIVLVMPRNSEARNEGVLERGTSLSALDLDLSGDTWRSQLFDNTFAKIQYGVQNLTNVPLEIDIFRSEKKRELLNLVLRKLEDVLNDLRFSQVQPSQLQELRSAILQDLWQTTATDFFGKYYTLRVGERDLEVVNIILQDAQVVQIEILKKIPLVIDLFSYLLFETPLTVDNASYSVGTPESLARAELLLQNLVIQVANAVVQPLLNQFADVETIKQNFYDRKLISTREIERFRNNLSWRYRLEKYVVTPRAIFESRYNLFFIDGIGIIKTSIYAPRVGELKQLSGIQLAVTLALETRDAIAPRLQAVVAFIGSAVVYLLTQVVGRGIGLIGRGILEGIGNSLQESRFGKNGDRK